MKLKSPLFLLFILLTMVTSVYAEGDLTSASDKVNSMFVILAQLMVLIVFVLGVAFIFLSISKYKKHKKSPTFVPMSTVVMMFVCGLVMIGIGVMYYYTGNKVFGSEYLSILEPPDENL